MNSPFFIASRYLFSKKTHNVINIISGISVAGILVSTAALVIVLSAFNGIEDLVVSLTGSFEAEIKIEASRTKTFDRNFVPQELFDTEGLVNYSEAIEEIAIVKNEEEFIIGTIKGVEDEFLEMTKMSEHMMDGPAVLHDQYGPLGLVGTGVLIQLQGLIFEADGPLESFTIYAPRKDTEIKRNSADAFQTRQIPIVGAFSYNNEVDENYLLVPIDFAAEMMDYGNQITTIEMDFADDIDLEQKKEELQQMLGDDFRVRTNLERIDMIYQTSKSEKWITTLLLGFIFFLATFNMIASITMLVLEKRNDMQTLRAMGAKRKQMQQIFFFEGLLINGFGLIFGLGIGYLICWLQQTFGFVSMEGSHAEYFPIAFRLSDLFLILGITVGFGTLAAYLPSMFIVRRIVTN